MSFVIPGADPARSSTPETLFRDLSRLPEGPRHLWAHQADMLRDYLAHAAAPDLALELPTGAGKTLVGMLIAEWRRRERGERVVYLCPTVQLAKQALNDATKAGIAVVDLTGPSRGWHAGDEHRYRTGDAIAVAHYAALFNSNPRFDDSHLLVFDDAHAAASTIADAWTVKLTADESGYQEVIELLREGLTPAVADRYLNRDFSGSQWQDAHLVAPDVVASNLSKLTRLLSAATEGMTAHYGWRMIRESLDACVVIIAADELIVRPLLPPTSTHIPYTRPRQRLYLSATLGSGGELERAFGRTNITRMKAPEGWDERGTGRRFFVFPELIKDFAGAGNDPATAQQLAAFVTQLMRMAGRSVLLAPSNRVLEQARATLVPPDFTVVGADDIRDSLSALERHSPAVLTLANRYDGIDLPDHACRAIVMTGLPIGADPQERFFAYELGAKRVLQERTRTRFAQGSGRATRNANDWALVVVLGRDLVAFCGQRDAQAATHPEIRAELEFGLLNSQGRTTAEVLASVNSFLTQDDTWRHQVEPALRGLRDDKGRPVTEPDTAALAASATDEVRAVDNAWRGDWDKAVRATEQVLGALSGGTELRPYQALWNYIGAQWAREAATSTDPTFRSQAERFDRAAIAAAARTTWMPKRQAHRATSAAAPSVAEVDTYAATQMVALARSMGAARKVNMAVNTMLENLRQTRPDDYERGLVDLGRLLGATASKPSGEARADALWRWSSHLWIAWEAKSQAHQDHPISAAAIRQANTHLRAATADLDEELPPGSITVLVSPQDAIDPSAIPLAGDDLCFLTLPEVASIAEKTTEIWFSISGRLLDEPDSDALAQTALKALHDADLLPSTLVAQFRGSLF